MSSTSTDPNVKIPAAVAAAAAQSDELYKKTYQPETPADPPADPAAAPAEPAAQAAPVAPAAPAVDEKSWEHRYNSMKGRYDRAAATIRDQGEQIANLNAVIANMQTAPAPAASASEIRAESFLTPAEIESYGEDFINVVKKAAQEVAGSQISSLQQTIAGLETKLKAVTGSVVQDARQKFFDAMDAALPSWRQQNDDPNFISWLGLPDAYSGVIRHELLKTAYEQNNAPRVLAFFKGFLAEEAATSPAPAAEPAPTTPTVEKVPLEALAAPGRAKTAATTPPAEKPIINSAQITKFYADKAAGRYRGREDEANQFERQIFDAQRDGRIRN